MLFFVFSKKYSGVLFWIVFVTVAASAQKDVTRQSLYWIRYYNQLAFNTRWTLHSEIDDRRFFYRSKQHHLIMHTRLHYKLFKNADVAVGFTYSLQSPHNEESTSHLIIPEYRIVQETNLQTTISKKLTLNHRFRIDERFIHKNNGLELLKGSDFNVRFRYRLQAALVLNKTETTKPTTLKLANELMTNAGKNIVYNLFDQNRIYIALEQRFSSTWAAELGYLHWFQQRPSGNQFFARDIIRGTLYHYIHLKSSL